MKRRKTYIRSQYQRHIPSKNICPGNLFSEKTRWIRPYKLTKLVSEPFGGFLKYRSNQVNMKR